MKVWQLVALLETEQLIGIAQFAEELGFEGIMNADHVFFPKTVSSPYPYDPSGRGQVPTDRTSEFPDCWVSLAAMAAATKRLKFSSYTFILPLRHPLEVAKATATLSIMSGDRFLLGAGVGWMKEEFDVLGVDFASRGRRADEMIQILRQLWATGTVNFAGEFFQFDEFTISPTPRRNIPILIAGSSKSALRRAARLADGWLPPPLLPLEDLLQQIKQIGDLRKEAGRGSEPFDIITRLDTFDSGVIERLREAGVTGTLLLPPIGDSIGKLGQRSTLDSKKRAMEKVARTLV